MALDSFDLICTIGPSTFDVAVVARLIDSGVSRFRLPFSKEPPEVQRVRIATIHEAARGRALIIIMDLPGSKVRLDNPLPVAITAGQSYRIDFASSPASRDQPGRFGMTSFQPETLVSPGAVMVTGDGELAFEVQRVDATGMHAVAAQSGMLGPARGVAFLNSVEVQFAPLTARDIGYLAFLESGLVNALMLSFVESESDVEQALALAARYTRMPMQVYAKLETLKGIANMEAIAGAADFLVLARGDLLLNLGMADFCRAESAFLSTTLPRERLVVATQLFNSLSENALPNRSELTAYHLFVRSGISHFLLSFETTVGKSPLHTVQIMSELYHSWSN